MRSGRLPEPTGDIRADAARELRWAMAGEGLTVEKVLAMKAVLRLPAMAHAVRAVDPEMIAPVGFEVLVSACRDLGNGLRARILRNALAIDYEGPAKDLTARRLEFIGNHNDDARRAGTTNYIGETPRALYAVEQDMLEALVTALGRPPVEAPTTAPLPPTGAASAAGLPLPRQLPPATAYFCGRSRELTWLDSRSSRTGVAPLVVAIDGAAGVGKTALALEWAHRVSDAFPDGQLYADLQGCSPEDGPVSPRTVLSHFLFALGVRPDLVPVDEGQLTAAYRSVTAGRRLLVVLDNIATAEQVAPLVPGEAACVVIVTSRSKLPALTVTHGAETLTLDPLSTDESEALLAAVLGPERLSAEPDAAADVVARCASLPLALRIVAAKLRIEPHLSLSEMAARLARDDRLAVLELDGAEQLAVRTAFSLSYATLSTDEQRAFRLLGIVPGVDVTGETAAAMLDIESDHADRLLERLSTCHLMIRRDGARYAFHDLLHDYARELCLANDAEPDRRSALERLFAHYERTVRAASVRLAPTLFRLAAAEEPGPDPNAHFDEPDRAMSWLTAEHSNIIAVVMNSAVQGFPSTAWRLADSLRAYFLARPYAVDWLTVGHAGLDAAHQDRNSQAVAAMHILVGLAHRRLGDLTTAVAHLDQALQASTASSWLKGEAVAHCTLGAFYQEQGRLAEAIDHHKSATDIERRLGDRSAEATHLGNIGFALYESGNVGEAFAYCRDALALCREIGHQHGAAVNLDNLGLLYHQLDRLDEAADHLDHALDEYRRLHAPDNEAEGLASLAGVVLDAGDPELARKHAHESLALAREFHDVRVQVLASNALGSVSARHGLPEEAADWHGQALRLATDIGYRHGQVAALIGLADAAVRAGDPAGASAHADAALDASQECGFRILEGRALAVRGRAASTSGDRDAAHRLLTEAVAVFRECGCRIGESTAVQLLAALGN